MTDAPRTADPKLYWFSAHDEVEGLLTPDDLGFGYESRDQYVRLVDYSALRALLDDAISILKLALPCPRPWDTEADDVKLRIFRNIARDRSGVHPVFVEFLDVDGKPTGSTEPVHEFVRMPSGDWVVRTGIPPFLDSLWFDPNGKHPKSVLHFSL